jgi:2'-deoxynucleoside 5'-phosphate N-hydrolase
MKIYYAAAIRGAHLTDNVFLHKQIIQHLLQHYIVLTEHLADGSLKEIAETNLTDKEIHERDINLVKEADIIIAEVSNPSLGVGYELGRAVEMKKKILCLYRINEKRLSAMVRGSEGILTKNYNNPEEALSIIDEFLGKIEIAKEKTHSIEQINKNVMHDLLTGKHTKK